MQTVQNEVAPFVVPGAYRTFKMVEYHVLMAVRAGATDVTTMHKRLRDLTGVSYQTTVLGQAIKRLVSWGYLSGVKTRKSAMGRIPIKYTVTEDGKVVAVRFVAGIAKLQKQITLLH